MPRRPCQAAYKWRESARDLDQRSINRRPIALGFADPKASVASAAKYLRRAAKSVMAAAKESDKSRRCHIRGAILPCLAPTLWPQGRLYSPITGRTFRPRGVLSTFGSCAEEFGNAHVGNFHP